MSFSESLTDIVAANRNHLLGIHPSWARVRLRDIADIQNGYPFASELFSSSRPGTPLIRIRDIHRNTTETYFRGEYPPEFMVERGALLVGMDGDFSSAIWRGVPALLNQRCCKLSLTSKGYDSRLLAYCLPGYLAAINAHTSAITVKHLSSRTVYETPLPLPPLREQIRIADALDELLSDLDAGVAALERVRVKLKHYRVAVLKAAVDGTLTAEWRAQHHAAEPAPVLLTRILAERRRRWEGAQLQKFKEAGKAPPRDWKTKYKEPIAPKTEGLPALPDGWCWATIEQCSDLLQYGTSAKTGPHSDGVPVLRMGNIRKDGALDLTDFKYLPATHDEFPSLLLANGDLLFNRTNSAELVGKTGHYRGVPTPCSFASYLIRVRMLNGASPAMVSFAINGGGGRRWIKTVVTQMVGQANVNGSKLAAFVFPLAPEEEQTAIVEATEDQVSVIDHLEADLEAKLKSAQALRQSILRHAFTGLLVPQDPNDEPAEDLLKCIAAEREERARQAKAAKQPKPKTKMPRSRR